MAETVDSTITPTVAFVGVPGSTYTFRVQANGDNSVYASSTFSQPVVSIVPPSLKDGTKSALP